MLMQKVIKGISGISSDEADHILSSGIICNWWREVNLLPNDQVPLRLNERNLIWHQNRYEELDPLQGGLPFCRRSPFISTTAGVVERDIVSQTNTMTPAKDIALRFATNSWRQDGFLFFCYLFVLNKKSIGHRAFAEEIRDLNIYTGFSPYQPEGEITAKIIIPPEQIERYEFYSLNSVQNDISSGRLPRPSNEVINTNHFLPPENYHNIKEFLS